MKNAVTLAKLLIAAGLVILLVSMAWRFYEASQNQLRSFDDQGLRLLVPLLGTLCLGGGIFLLALSGGNKDAR